MPDTYGLFVSNQEKEVRRALPSDLSFSADLNMLKVKQEKHSMIGEVLNFDHGLNYFPFFLGFLKDANNILAGGKTSLPHTGNNNSVGVFVGVIQSDGFMYICYNPGAP